MACKSMELDFMLESLYFHSLNLFVIQPIQITTIELKKQGLYSNSGKPSICIGSIYWNASWRKSEWHDNLKKLDKICVKLRKKSELILMGDFNFDLKYLLKSDEFYSPQSKKGL